jgi:hypothetical protein
MWRCICRWYVWIIPFLPFEQVEDGFIQIMSSYPNETDGHIFSDYILKTYIEPGCLFSLEIWAKEPSIIPK